MRNRMKPVLIFAKYNFTTLHRKCKKPERSGAAVRLLFCLGQAVLRRNSVCRDIRPLPNVQRVAGNHFAK
jgi:hypothetical protein